MVSRKVYGQLRVEKEAVEEFKKCRDPDETRTDTLMKLIKTYQKHNRKCPDCSDPGVHKTIVENA